MSERFVDDADLPPFLSLARKPTPSTVLGACFVECLRPSYPDNKLAWSYRGELPWNFATDTHPRSWHAEERSPVDVDVGGTVWGIRFKMTSGLSVYESAGSALNASPKVWPLTPLLLPDSG